MEATRSSKTLVNFYQTVSHPKIVIFIVPAVRTLNVIDYIEQRPSGEANSSSAIQEIPSIL
jgi:hypothetical protein